MEYPTFGPEKAVLAPAGYAGVGLTAAAGAGWIYGCLYVGIDALAVVAALPYQADSMDAKQSHLTPTQCGHSFMHL